MRASFHIGCTLCNKIAVEKVGKEQGFSVMDYYLCKEHLPIFKAEHGVEEDTGRRNE